jgi:predicted metalloprotease with PDZ domain
MYEGVTEYFANLFQINQGLITEEDFYNRLSDQMERACNERHHVFYYNECKRVETALQRSIHQRISKGSLIGMCWILLEKKAREKAFLI